MMFYVYLLLTLLFSSVAFSQESESTDTVSDITIEVRDEEDKETLLPEIIVNKNNEIIIKLQNGNEMALARPEIIRETNLKLEAEMTDNTCVPDFKRVMCSYNMNIVDERLSLSWVKHSDASRVGKMVLKFDEYDGEESLYPAFEEFSLWMWEYRKQREARENFPVFIYSQWSSEYQSMLKNPVLICEDMSWASTTFGNNKNKSVINEWAVELNLPNAETLLNENLMVQAYMDVEFNLSKQGIEFTDYGFTPLVSEDGVAAGFSFGDVIGWSILDQGDACEVSLKVDSATLLAQLIELLQISKDTVMVPLRLESANSNLDKVLSIGGDNGGSSIEENKEDIIKAKGLDFYKKIKLLEGFRIISTGGGYSNGNQKVLTIFVQEKDLK